MFEMCLVILYEFCRKYKSLLVVREFLKSINFYQSSGQSSTAMKLYRFILFNMRCYAYAVFVVARCLSVCPSVTLVYCIQLAEDIVKLFVRTGSLIILVF